jgi:transketolase
MLKDIQVTGQKDTRSGFGDGIVEAARKNPNIVALTADLLGSMKLNQFIKEFPERFVQCGIAEANMIGIAAGLTINGKIPLRLLSPIFLRAGYMTRSVSPSPIPVRM